MKQFNLSAYNDLLLKENLLTKSKLKTAENMPVLELTYNSKEVKPGTLFVCKGLTFKEEYLKEAIERGAIGYVSEREYDFASSISALIVSDIRLAMPHLADLFFNSPNDQLKIIAVGGTKGKTTTTHYIKEIMDSYLKKEDKKKCGLISSIKVFDGKGEYPATNTTPEAIELQRYLANAVESGLEYIVLEVSSQALKYNRVDCLYFDVGIFLNISNDHISPMEHEDFKDYFHSKMKMFEQTKRAVINHDTDFYDQIMTYTNDLDEVRTYSKKDQEADFFGYDVESDGLKTRFKVKSDNKVESFNVGMPGIFNFENAMAAIAVATMLDIPLDYAKKSLENVHVPGRMELCESKDGLLTTVVDYAHNKLSFERLYPMLTSHYPDSYVVAVFGARGGKALNRRKELVEIVGEYADEAILTMIHPDMEELADINKVLSDNIAPYDIAYQIIEDRGEAIRTAMQSVNKKTLIIITGRGHEGNQKIKGEYIKTPTDIEYVREYMKEYNENHPV